jgi:hypothetical protein
MTSIKVSKNFNKKIIFISIYDSKLLKIWQDKKPIVGKHCFMFLPPLKRTFNIFNIQYCAGETINSNMMKREE